MSAARLQVLLVVILSVAAVAGFLLWRKNAELQRSRAELVAAQSLVGELDKLRAEVDRLAGENRRLNADAVDPNEVARLRAGVTELNRLKAEKAALEKKFADAEAARARMAEAARAQAAPLVLPSAPASVAITGRVSTPPRQTVIVKVGVTPDGRQSVLFLTPMDIRQEDGTRAIQVEAHVVALSQEAVNAGGLGWLAESANGLAPTADVSQALRTLSAQNGVDVLAMPSVVTRLGGQANVSIGDGTGTGISLNVLPQRTGDSAAIDLTYSLERRE